MRKIILLFLIISVISVCLASAEIVERGPNWNKFSSSGSSFSLRIYNNVINVYNGTGYSMLNTAIGHSNYLNYIYELNTSNYQAYFRNNSNTAEAVRFEKEGYFFTYDLSGGEMMWRAKPGQPNAWNTLGSGMSNSRDSYVKVIQTNEVMYPGAFYNTNVTYALSNDMLKENFVLYGLPSYKDYLYLEYSGNIKFNKSLDICANDICYKTSAQGDFETSGKIELKDKNNKTIFYLTEPIIIDSNGTSILGLYSVHGSDAQMNFWLRINKTFLETAAYPIDIDPSVKIEGNNAGGSDSYISSAFPNTNYGSIDELDVKWLNAGAKLKSYIQFNISSIPSNQIIDNSTLCLYMFSDLGSHIISVYHVYTNWTESSITWNNQPCGADFDNNTNCNLTAESFLSNDGNQDDAWQCWNVTNMIRKQYGSNNKSVSMVLQTQNSLNSMDKFYSKEYSNSSLWPYLNITYHLADSIVPNLTIISPLNQSYNNATILVNISASDANLDSVWFYNGSANLTYTSPVLYNFQQGSNSLIAYANDSSGNLNSTSVVFYIDILPPVINIIEPEAKTYGYNLSIPLSFSVLDENLEKCWYNLDSGKNITIAGCHNTTFNASEGSHTLYFYANDSFGNENYASRLFSINTKVAVSLVSPQNNKWVNYREIEFNYTVGTAGAVNNCSLWGNFNGIWHLNQTNSSSINITGGINKFNLNLTDGNYIWNVLCSGTYSAFALNNFTLSIDSEQPVLGIAYPLNNTAFRQNVSVPLNFTVSDANLNSCLYSLNNGGVNYSLSCANGDNNIIFGYAAGNYNLTIWANDSAKNLALFKIYNLTVEWDSAAPNLTISEPTVTQTSRTGIPLTFSVSDNVDSLQELSCWYNLSYKTGDYIRGAEISGCLSTNFDVPVDSDYIIYLSARDRTGNTNAVSSNFSVSTSVTQPSIPSTGGSGGSGGGTTTNASKSVKLEISPVQDMIVNPGESKRISITARNTGTSFLNNCKLAGKGENSGWISSEGTRNLGNGEIYEFTFNLKIPINLGVGRYNVGVGVECGEGSKDTSFSLEIIEKKLNVELNDITREGNNKLKIVYSISEMSNQEQDVEVEIIGMDNSGKRVFEVKETKQLGAGAKERYETLADISGFSEKNINILINAKSGVASAFVQQGVILGNPPLAGLAILSGIGNEGVGVVIIVLVLGVFSFLIVRRIVKFRKMAGLHKVKDKGYASIVIKNRKAV